MVVIVFQSVFYSEMHQNNTFFIFKNAFLLLVYQNNLKILKIKNKHGLSTKARAL
jgi:hypothetical protein